MKSRAVLERRTLLAARLLVDRMRDIYRELERLTGAPIGVHRALACIHEEQGICASKLATALGMRRPAVSHVLNGLAQRKWIERIRSAADQRSIMLHLTPAGRQIVSVTAGRAAGTLQRAVRSLSNDSLKGLDAGLAALLMHLPKPIQTTEKAARKSKSRR